MATAKQEKARAKVDALHRQLSDGVDTLRNEPEWRRMLDVASRFHDYSFGNVMLIMMQRPDATRVAGYRKWQELDRQVVKGSKAIKILAPASGPCWDCNGDGGDANARCVKCGGSGRFRYFRSVSVFDVSDTEGEPLPDISELVREVDGDAYGLIGHLTALADAEGFTVDMVDAAADPVLKGGAYGYCQHDKRRLVVRDDVADAQKAKTLCHELAHALLHGPDQIDYGAERGRCEVEAESVAYIVLGTYGIDTDGYSFGYVAHWSENDHGTIKATAETVCRTARDVLDGLADLDDPARELTSAGAGQGEPLAAA